MKRYFNKLVKLHKKGIVIQFKIKRTKKTTKIQDLLKGVRANI
jgi:hypothetical protein